jgi:hypothetical protein
MGRLAATCSQRSLAMAGPGGVGDAKIDAEGKADKVEGKVQNAIGGVKDALRK